MEYKIVLIKVDIRTDNAPKVQKIFTDYGSYIKVRLGLHDNADSNSTASSGLIFLELFGKDEAGIEKMVAALNDIDGVSAKYLKI